jgi:hypothetical protein
MIILNGQEITTIEALEIAMTEYSISDEMKVVLRNDFNQIANLPTPSEIQESYLKNTIRQRKEYADDLLERLKQKNISEGINALQGMWMHSRMRALPITFMGLPFTQDIMNMAVSGDIEIACLTLMNATPDDMTQPYHWWSQDRINWLITDMKNYLGWP